MKHGQTSYHHGWSVGAALVFVGLMVAGQASTRRVWKQSAPSRRGSSVGFLWVKVDCVISQEMLHSSTLDLLRRKGGGAIAFGGPRSWYCLCRLIPPSTPRDCSRDLACWSEPTICFWHLGHCRQSRTVTGFSLSGCRFLSRKRLVWLNIDGLQWLSFRSHTRVPAFCQNRRRTSRPPSGFNQSIWQGPPGRFRPLLSFFLTARPDTWRRPATPTAWAW